MFGLLRKTTGWRELRGREGFRAELPGATVHKRSTAETRHGQLNLSIYSTRTDDNLSCQITVRTGPAVEALTDTELFDEWKTEFVNAMAASGIAVQLEGEVALCRSTGRDLTLSSRNGAVLMRIRLLRDMARLAALTAIGPRDLAQPAGQRFLDSFRWTGA